MKKLTKAERITARAQKREWKRQRDAALSPLEREVKDLRSENRILYVGQLTTLIALVMVTKAIRELREQ